MERLEQCRRQNIHVHYKDYYYYSYALCKNIWLLKENKSIAIKDINTYKTFSIFLYQGIREASSLLRPVWKVSDIRPQSYISVRVKCWNLRHTKTFTCYGLIKLLKFNSFFKFRVVKRQLRQWNPESNFFSDRTVYT